jgi:nitroreductase
MRAPIVVEPPRDGEIVEARGSDASVDLRDHTEEIVWAATRAPSYRNTQPWSFRVAARQVEVYADRTRSCPVADPEGRQLFLGLGAAVFGVRLALSQLRLRPVVGLSRDHAHPDLAAVVVAAGRAHAPDEEDRLYRELGRRRTAWTPSAGDVLPVELEVQLAECVRHEGASARWLRADLSRKVIDLSSRVAVDRQADAPLLLETADWPTAMPSPEPPPALLAICTSNDHRADWLRAGQALHHALLAASAAGLAGSFLGQVLEVPALRSRLRADLHLPGCAQSLLGFSRPRNPLPPTRRRAVADVLRS